LKPFQPKTIYYTPASLNQRGREIIEQFPEALTEEIKQHNRLPHLDAGHYKIKSDVIVLGTLKSQQCKWSGRSSDYIAPSLANGCFGGCTYCYVDRNKPVNPITLFTNTDEILTSIDRHVHSLPWVKVPNQTDPVYYTYDIGCNSDISIDATLGNNVYDTMQFFKEHPRAKATFATKFVNREMLNFDPARKTRIRFSLMPATISKLVDVRTDAITDRIAAINDFYEAGYEVHINFSPVIVYGGKQWRQDYEELFKQLDATVHSKVKQQMQSEVIFLTHNAVQHEQNLLISPKAEELLWTPELQESKISQFGGVNIRYKRELKSKMISVFEDIHQKHLPWSKIRYIF
jgi:spore photoproduct lyase